MRYQDYVIKNGKFVGKFEEMYQKFSDPWGLLCENNKKVSNLNYGIIYNYCYQIKQTHTRKLITLELGCGYSQISYHLFKNNFKVYGTDISKTVINKSKKKYPKIKNNLFVSEFLNFKLYEKINPDIIILSDISWYVLPELKKFINWFKKLKKNTYLIHMLPVYKKNVQKYGRDYFYDLETLKKFFKLNYLSSGYLEGADLNKHTYFIASNKKRKLVIKFTF